MQIFTIGELLWDVFDETEFLGGAPLNFSAAAQRLGNSVTFISAVGRDARGAAAIRSMARLGLAADFVSAAPARDTGTAKVTTDDRGNARYFIQRPAAFDDLALDSAQMSWLMSLHPKWLYFGTLAQTNQANEDLVHRLVQQMPGMKCFYDMNLRTGHWNLPLVQRLSALASIVKLNEEEAQTLFRLTSTPAKYSLEEFCRTWSSTYSVETICVTCGGDGCAIFTENALNLFPGFPVDVVDTVGAGDAFAAAFLHGRILNWPIERTAQFANALGALIASRAGATPIWTNDECLRLLRIERELDGE